MRVITGSARGRRLKTPEGQDIRPTTDNVKESVFNILQFDIEGRRVLDLFAGTGQLGIECLSRGAKEAVFIDQNRDAVKIVRENLKACGLSAPVLQQDALSYLNACGKFDAVFGSEPDYAPYFERAYPWADYVLVDSSRTEVPISGTQIREMESLEEVNKWIV